MPLARSVFAALASLRSCPWGSLARRALGLPAGIEPLANDLAGIAEPWCLPAPPGASGVGAGGATWMPVVGVQPWEDDPDVHGDPDLLRRWSRGRLREVLHAALVARHGRDASAAAFALRRVAAFEARCPPGGCEHWSSGMEIALRAARLLHAASHLRAARDEGLGMPDPAPLARALERHEQALESHVDWRLHRTGNHYLVVLAGRILLAAHLPPTPVRLCRLARDARLFFTELDRQVGPDGMHFESSTHYHLLVAECAAQVDHALRARGMRSPGSAALVDMAAIAFPALLRPDGTIACVGDSDDESFVPAVTGPEPPPAMRALEVAAALGCPGPSLESDWLGPGGLAVLAMAGPPIVHVTASACTSGRGGTGGHFHDDATSADVWLDGPLLVGCRGTGAYAADRTLRERLRSVVSHAVVQVDGRSMNDPHPANAFRRRQRAHAFMSSLDRASDGTSSVSIGHHGFAVTAPGALVMRRLTLLPSGVVAVEDEITGTGAHSLTLRLPWAPGALPSTPRSGGGPGVEIDIAREGRANATCRVSARDPDGRELPLVVEHVAARHAVRQGESVAAWTTEVRVRTTLPATLRHEIGLLPGAGGLLRDDGQGGRGAASPP